MRLALPASGRWENIFLIGLTGLALLFVYFPFVQTLIEAWKTNEDYSHGYFIPFLAVYMIYIQRDTLRQMPIRASNSGFFVIVGGLLLLIAGKIGSEFFVQRFSLIIVLSGILLFLFGRQIFSRLLLPICYLIFMIPLPAIIWNQLAFPMQLFSSALTEKIVYMFGVPIFREGNVLHLSEMTLEVVAACSGLRSLVTMFALAGFLAFLSSRLSTGRKWILFFLAAPTAICANIVRLTSTAFLASRFGAKVAHGFLHDFSGVLVFLVGIVLLTTFYRFLQPKTSL